METKRALGGGAIAGIVGGGLMALYMLFATLMRGGDLWLVVKGSALPFLGQRAVAPGFDGTAALVGLLTTFAISAFWGALFGVLFYGLSFRGTMAMGFVWGLVVWIGMYFVALPLFGLGDVARATPVWRAIVTHLVFGVGVAIGFLPFQRERPARWTRYRRREVLP
jgi:hypothetical protein